MVEQAPPPRAEDAHVIQPFGHLAPARVALGENVRRLSVAALNRMLAHTMALRDLYKKRHWQMSGETFYSLHLLFDNITESRSS
jgi:starvation-inducible DNA-binding protein